MSGQVWRQPPRHPSHRDDHVLVGRVITSRPTPPVYAPGPHPSTGSVLALGLLSLAFLPAGLVAWTLARSAKADMRAEPGRWQARNPMLGLGHLLGMVSSVLLCTGVLLLLSGVGLVQLVFFLRGG